MTKTLQCRNCGRILDSSQNFCGGCGVSVMADADPGDPYIGRMIDGKYLIEQLLGMGAMGVVYRAKQVSLNKRVALKILRRSLIGDPTVILRFKQEARAASRLNHPNTIQILDFGELPDVGLYMAMEYVEGRDLGKFIQHDLPLPPLRIIRIIKQVLSALDEAHGQAIIHRDIKPANVLVCNLRSAPDHVKVLDFGIAKILDPEAGEMQPMTRDGFVCGTPAFMSPEQVQGLELDARTDLFSLGIVLYQCLTGKLPFEADSAVEMATKIVVEHPVPPQQVRPEWNIPLRLQEIVLQALAKARHGRFQSAGEMLTALEQTELELTLAGEADPSVTPARWSPHPAEAPARQLIGLPLPLDPRDAGANLSELSASLGPQRALISLPIALARQEDDSPVPSSASWADSVTVRTAAYPDEETVTLDPQYQPTERLEPLSVLQAPQPSRPASAVSVHGGHPAGKHGLPIEPPAQAASIPSAPTLPQPARWQYAVYLAGLLLLAVGSLLVGRLLGDCLSSTPGSRSPDQSIEVIDIGPPDLGSGPAPVDVGLEDGSPTRWDAAEVQASARPVAKKLTQVKDPRPHRLPLVPGGGGDTRTKTAIQQARELQAEGLTLMKSAQLELALARFKEASGLAPGIAELYRDMGRIHMRRGRKAEAVSNFNRYLQLAPTAEDATTYQRIILQLQP